MKAEHRYERDSTAFTVEAEGLIERLWTIKLDELKRRVTRLNGAESALLDALMEWQRAFADGEYSEEMA